MLNSALRSDNDALRILAASAVASVGFSIGDRISRLGIKEILFWLILGLTFILPGWLMFTAIKGHDPKKSKIIPIIIPIIVLLAWAYYVLAVPLAPEPMPISEYYPFVWCISVLSGFIYGLVKRRERLKGFKIVEENIEFLEKNYITPMGGREQTFRDQAGNELRIRDLRDRDVILEVLGRPGKWAYLNNDEEGRFTSYVPPIGV